MVVIKIFVNIYGVKGKKSYFNDWFNNQKISLQITETQNELNYVHRIQIDKTMHLQSI